MTRLAATSHGAHLGGALGAGALSLVLAGCAFLQSQQTGLAQGFVPLPVINAIPAQITEPSAADPDPPVVIAQAAAPEIIAQAAQPVTIAEPVAPIPSIRPDRPAPAVPPAIRPALPVEPVQAPIGPQPAEAGQAVTQRAEFIVKLRPDERIDAVISTWRRDKDASRAAFAAWAEGDPLFSGLDLVGCSYSGELILAADIRAPARAIEAEVDRLVARLRGHAAVSYADPDFIANPALTEN